MKKIVTIMALLILSAGVANTAYSQKKGDNKKNEKPSGNDKKADKGGGDDKAEKKVWKKKAKSYVKDPKNELENNNKQLRDLSAKNADLTKKLSACNGRVDSLQSILTQVRNEVESCNEQKKKLQAQLEAKAKIVETDIQPGLIYKVQIGAFVHFDMNMYLRDTDKNFEGENQDGMNKYTIGKFRDMELAEAFRKDVQKLGIKDAWIVPFIDGRRSTLDEARKYMESKGMTPPQKGTGK
jgi:hypothetical protein